MTGRHTPGQLRGELRTAYGVTVTVENAEGKTLTLHRHGRGALERVCDDAVALDPTFRIISISTPETIYGDLAGRLPSSKTGAIILPEHQRLGNIGRMAMIHPRIAPRHDNALRKHRARGDSWE